MYVYLYTVIFEIINAISEKKYINMKFLLITLKVS